MNATTWSSIVDICGIAGLPVGVVGLLITIKTFYEAKKAKEAALQAAETVWRKNAASDFRSISQRAKELLQSVQDRQSQLATIRAAEILQTFEIAFGRWRPVLPAESVRQLGFLQSQIRAVSHSLSVRGIPEGAELFETLSDRCHTLLSVLSAEAGRVELNAEVTDHD